MSVKKNNNPVEKESWQELAPGGIITTAGNSTGYMTGTWRTWRPVWNHESCISCLTCWVFCPEESIFIKDGSSKSGKAIKLMNGIDYDYCKGCGLCVRECLVNKKGNAIALSFVKEEK